MRGERICGGIVINVHVDNVNTGAILGRQSRHCQVHAMLLVDVHVYLLSLVDKGHRVEHQLVHLMHIFPDSHHLIETLLSCILRLRFINILISLPEHYHGLVLALPFFFAMDNFLGDQILPLLVHQKMRVHNSSFYVCAIAIVILILLMWLCHRLFSLSLSLIEIAASNELDVLEQHLLRMIIAGIAVVVKTIELMRAILDFFIVQLSNALAIFDAINYKQLLPRNWDEFIDSIVLLAVDHLCNVAAVDLLSLPHVRDVSERVDLNWGVEHHMAQKAVGLGLLNDDLLYQLQMDVLHAILFQVHIAVVALQRIIRGHYVIQVRFDHLRDVLSLSVLFCVVLAMHFYVLEVQGFELGRPCARIAI